MLISPFEFFSKFSATWQHGRCDRSAAHSVRWQVLELIFGGLLTTHARVSETSGSVHARVSESSASVHARVSETSGSVHVRVSETHVSSTFPCTK